MEKIKKIGKFNVLETIGCGGFSTVYRCRDDESGKHFALKVGNDCIRKEYHEKKEEIEQMTHMEEWHAYKALNFGKGTANDHGIPEVFETGIAQLPSGSLRPYLVMQLLGQNLSGLICNRELSKERLLRLGHSLLDVIEYIHSAGYIHRDIKPSNFCFLKRCGRRTDCVFVLDFGFACKEPKLDDDERDDYVGTPDYSSTSALRSGRQGFRDDLESLAYTFLELWLGDLPWYLTSEKSGDGAWTRKSLLKMSRKREKKWIGMIELDRIPCFLVEWVKYCRELKICEKPDYQFLHSLLTKALNQLQSDSRHKRKSRTDSEDSKTTEDDFTSPYKRLCLSPEE